MGMLVTGWRLQQRFTLFNHGIFFRRGRSRAPTLPNIDAHFLQVLFASPVQSAAPVIANLFQM
jgi:hypothetical protein